MIGNAFFTSDGQNWFKCWYCQNVCDALSYRLENILIRFGTKLYKQIVEIALGTNCAPLIADFIMKRDSMMSLSDDLQAYRFEAFYLRFQIFGRSFE